MLLPFEKPIAALDTRIEELKKQVEEGEKRLEKALKKLTAERDALQKEVFDNLTRWQRVQLARHPQRPYTLDYLQAMCPDFVELHGDRKAGDDPAIVGGLGTLGGETVCFIGHQKGRTTQERQARNFGMANPEGYRKALRLMRLAEKFGHPIVTLIDTPGAYPGLEAEERGQGQAIAANLQEMFTLTVPVLCIVIGEGASGGALGIGVGDRVLMLENTWYSVISPESCAAILWKSWDYKEQAAEQLHLTAKDMLHHGLIDAIVPEPPGGAHRAPTVMVEHLQQVILKELKPLQQQAAQARIKKRRNKFYAMGELREKGAT